MWRWLNKHISGRRKIIISHYGVAPKNYAGKYINTEDPQKTEEDRRKTGGRPEEDRRNTQNAQKTIEKSDSLKRLKQYT